MSIEIKYINLAMVWSFQFNIEYKAYNRGPFH